MPYSLYVVLLGVYTGHESGMLTMQQQQQLFVESIHEMTHIRECFNFFVSADILMGCARQKVTILIATVRRGDAASRFFPLIPRDGSALQIDTWILVCPTNTHTHMQISMAICALSNKVDIM